MSNITTDRRKQDIDRYKSVPPYHNGRWYYSYFVGSFLQREELNRR